MLSSASRRTDNLVAATGALLLQLGFIAAFLHAFSSQAPPKQLAHELTFFLPRLLPKSVPAAPIAPSRAASAPLNVPAFVLPPLSSLRLAPPVANAPPAGLQNFGRALFGCAPENYARLTAQQRALCPPSGPGIAIQGAPSLMDLPSQTKDETHWKEELQRKQAPTLLLGFLLGTGGVYPADTPATRENIQEQQMETWDPCPQVANAPCLHKVLHGDSRLGAPGVP